MTDKAIGPLRQRAKQDPWLASKPRKLVAVALANKMARFGWTLMTRQEDFRGRPAAALSACRRQDRKACEGEHA